MNGSISPSRHDLFATRRLLGGGAPGEGSDGDRHGVSARFESSHAIRAAIERAAGLGARGIVSMSDRKLFAALGRRADPRLPRLMPIVPNIQGFMRDAVEHGLVGAGLHRVKRVGPAALAGLGLRGMGRVPALLRRDFPTMLLCFIELELADFRPYEPERIFLQAQMTDLALAMDCPRMVEVFIDAVRRLSPAEPGFATRNFGLLIERFEGWGFPVGAAIAPWEASGANMRPHPENCRRAIERCACALWADRGGRIDPPNDEDRRCFEHDGVRGALRDDDRWLGVEPKGEAA